MIKILVFLISLLGLVSGIILAYFVKDEIKPGKKYFIVLEKAILIFLGFVLILRFIKLDKFILIFIIGLFAGLILRKAYLYLGIILASFGGFPLIIFASLTFLLGLPKGALIFSDKGKKNITKEVIISAICFMGGILISYIFNYLPLLIFSGAALFVIAALGSKKIGIIPFF